MEFDIGVYGSDSTTTKSQLILSALSLSSSSFLVHDYIMHRCRREEKKNNIQYLDFLNRLSFSFFKLCLYSS